MLTFYASVFRKNTEGIPAGGFQIENALTREQALRSITIWAAKAGFEEQKKGSIELGKSADFVLLDAATIHSDLHSAITSEGWKDGLPTNALLIGGPSKTADIQQTLAYGAHGPKELIVLLRHTTEATS